MAIPMGMDQLMAHLALTNPQAVAAMAASRGMMPPPVQSPTVGVRDQATGGFNMAQMQPTGVPSPTDAALSLAPGAINAAAGLAAPTGAGGGFGGRQPWPPQPPQPGGQAAPQMADILKLLMTQSVPTPGGLGAQILGK